MLNKKELLDKKRYFINRLQKGNLSINEENSIRSSLIPIIYLLTENDKFLSVKLYNLIDKLSNNQLSLKTRNDLSIINSGIKNQSPVVTLDNNYLYYLIQLALNIQKMDVYYEKEEYDSIKMDDEDIVALSREFYNTLSHNGIKGYARRVIDDSSHYEFVHKFSNKLKGMHAVTLYDEFFNKNYILISKTNNIMDIISFNHEVMHAVDSYISPGSISSNYGYYNEVPTFIIDELFLDFLNAKGFDQEQVNIARRSRISFMKYLAKKTLNEIAARLLANNISSTFNMGNIHNIRNVLDNEIVDRLLEIEGYIMAFGLYEEIKRNRQIGLDKLYHLMTYRIPDDRLPDFSYIGYDKYTIMTISRNLGMLDNEIINKHRI